MSSEQDDESLWRVVIKSVKPLKGREKPVLDKTSPQKALQKDPAKPITKSTQKKGKIKPTVRTVLPPVLDEARLWGAQLSAPMVHGLERQRRDQIKKDKMVIDGTIDLHGMTQEKAFVVLERFCQRHLERQSRLLLVVTGKGSVTAGGGVLKKALPYWLKQILGVRLLALDQALPRHGGAGAFYVLMRRQRS